MGGYDFNPARSSHRRRGYGSRASLGRMDEGRIQGRSANDRPVEPSDGSRIPRVAGGGPGDGGPDRSDHQSTLWSSPAQATIADEGRFGTLRLSTRGR